MPLLPYCCNPATTWRENYLWQVGVIIAICEVDRLLVRARDGSNVAGSHDINPMVLKESAAYIILEYLVCEARSEWRKAGKTWLIVLNRSWYKLMTRITHENTTPVYFVTVMGILLFHNGTSRYQVKAYRVI
jgi:hypothetical protein